MNNNCICTAFCKFIGFVAAIFAGILTGALFFFGVFSAAIVPLQAILIFGAVSFFGIVIALILSRRGELEECLCRLRRLLLTGAVGTFLSAVVAFFVALSPFSILSAIVIGLVAFFLILLIGAIICLVRCVADCD